MACHFIDCHVSAQINGLDTVAYLTPAISAACKWGHTLSQPSNRNADSESLELVLVQLMKSKVSREHSFHHLPEGSGGFTATGLDQNQQEA